MTKNENNTSKTTNKRLTIIAVLLFLILLLLLVLKFCSGPTNTNSGNSDPLPMDDTQGDYTVPEMANFVDKNIRLPGWGSFTIQANTTSITKGFEFHNPDSNHWYEVDISYNNSILENLIVDYDMSTSIEHYAKLAGLKGSTFELKKINEDYFKVIKEDDKTSIQALKEFDGTQDIVISVDGQDYNLKASCRENVYYMTFALYLADNDELLYQSNLVAPGKYIQSMEISRALSKGDYSAYVMIQPYRSDKSTKTNNGKVVIDLKVR